MAARKARSNAGAWRDWSFAIDASSARSIVLAQLHLLTVVVVELVGEGHLVGGDG
ncbi:hypothetical protein [Myxococcus vastator]|uniref:hypothetical protein n=1 Tax=Myxococcus vastator TaxID=2709664 RepID=UPI001967BB56|nr:hypothetical protein [Myxococcus vastator]